MSITHIAGRVASRGGAAIINRLPSARRARLLDSLYRRVTAMPSATLKEPFLGFLSDQHRAAPVLSDVSNETTCRVRNAAESIYGSQWNAFSDALRPEMVQCFNQTIEHLHRRFQRIDYLEIGSAQGVSMALIGSALSRIAASGQLVSVDPYYDDGYTEDGFQVSINRSSKESARSLYGSLNLSVNHIHKTSSDGLVELLKQDKRFHLIYIDGYHSGLTPTLDFGLSYHLLHNGGVIMIDDHVCRDILPLKMLLDRHCQKICECWKVACYEFTRA
jgi:predicted O-methyltransferase YrrM